MRGLARGYLLTGRHGFFASYEAFIRIIDSMAAQHAKWLKVCNGLPWRQPIASLNLILASNVWQQIITTLYPSHRVSLTIANKGGCCPSVPAAARCKLPVQAVSDHCIKTKPAQCQCHRHPSSSSSG